MRFISTAATLFSAAVLTACGGGGDGSPSEDRATMAFDGNWQGGCAPDGDGYATEIFDVAGETGSVQVRAYDDADCANALFEYESPITFDYGDRVALSDGSVAQSVDIVYDSSLTITPLTETAAANLSANSFCGATTYSNGVAADIGSCAQAGELVERAGDTLPQIAAIEAGTAGDVLLFGDLGSEALDATQVRPSALDRRTLYVRNGS